jgi:hypothetical protein
MAIDTVGEPVGGNVTLDERIALDLRMSVNEPQSQSGSGCEYDQAKKPSLAAWRRGT